MMHVTETTGEAALAPIGTGGGGGGGAGGGPIVTFIVRKQTRPAAPSCNAAAPCA
jgi:hypothetical protein